MTAAFPSVSFMDPDFRFPEERLACMGERDELRFRLNGVVGSVCAWEDVGVVVVEEPAALFACFANMACIPSLRSEMGSMNVGDSVPIFPTSFGTW